MKILYYIVLITFSSVLLAQNEYIIEKNINIDEKQKKLFKLTYDWLTKQENLKILENTETNIKASGYFNFIDNVVYKESETISRAYQKQINGKIVFLLNIEVQDNMLKLTLSDFQHKPNLKYDGINFGKITDTPEPPEFLLIDYDREYCTEVWQSMKNEIMIYAEKLFSNMPGQLISSR
ncbi:MAG: hypothetical protein Kow0068_04090 [Marinilabiliales bacterium]